MFKNILFLFAAVALTACVTQTPDFVEPPNGVPLNFSTTMGKAFLGKRYANVYVAARTQECRYQTEGVIRFEDLKEGTSLEVGKTYGLRTILVLDRGNQINETVIDHELTPTVGSVYEMQIIYEKGRYGVNIFENGKKLQSRSRC